MFFINRGRTRLGVFSCVIFLLLDAYLLNQKKEENAVDTEYMYI